MLVFHRNSPQISSNSNFCNRLKNELNTTKQWIPEIDGKPCAYTNLEVIDFLDNLECVVLSPYIAEISVEYNKKLVSAKFPKLKKAGVIHFLENENLVFDQNLCFGVMNALNVTELRDVRFADDNCDTIVAKLMEGNTGSRLSDILSIFVFVISLY
ncbi:unnamed protein product [Caenorhabditis nigoni]